jgi:hypothetical protein
MMRACTKVYAAGTGTSWSPHVSRSWPVAAGQREQHMADVGYEQFVTALRDRGRRLDLGIQISDAGARVLLTNPAWSKVGFDQWTAGAAEARAAVAAVKKARRSKWQIVSLSITLAAIMLFIVLLRPAEPEPPRDPRLLDAGASLVAETQPAL